MDKDFLMKMYGECYGPEAGPWNLSVTSKYLEYMIAKFFEENFIIDKNMHICNIGIGAGYWDRYLSYKIGRGNLTSIDIDAKCCKQLSQGLENERNPNSVSIICSDVMNVQGFENKFDIVTMIGSSRLESGKYDEIIAKAISFLTPNGSLYYQTLDNQESKAMFESVCEKIGAKIEAYLLDETYGIKAQYWKATKT